MKREILLAAILGLPLLAVPAQAGGPARPETAASAERFSRAVDLVALQTNREAAAALKDMLARSPRSADLLIRKVDLDQEGAGLAFRLDHGGGAKGRWKSLLKETVASAGAFLTAHASHPEVPRALLIRGQANEELGDGKAAAKDYREILVRFPEHAGYGAAVLALAQQAIDRNEHGEALSLLARLESRPQDPRHAIALHRMSWSHFNLGHVDSALDYSRRLFDHATRVSDSAMRDAALLDLPVFQVEGVEKKLPDYSGRNGLELFSSFVEGPELGRMAVRYAKLLRAKDQASELLSFIDAVAGKRRLGDSADALEAAALAFEYFRNRRETASILAMAERIAANPASRAAGEAAEKARLRISELMDELHAKIARENRAADLPFLRGLSQAYLATLPRSDVRTGRVHYNLAETEFAVGAFGAAEADYRQAVEVDAWKTGLSRDASLRALSSRFEALKAEGLIPAELKVAALPEKDGGIHGTIEAWERAIDVHRAKTGEPVAELELALGRAWFASGRPRHAVERLHQLVRRSPAEPASEAAAALVIDAGLASQRWEATSAVLREFTANRALLAKREGFERKIRLLLGEVEYRTDLEKVQKICADRKPECAGSLDAMIDRAARLAKQGSVAGLGAGARILRAKVRLENYAWDLASEDLAAAATEAKDPELEREIRARSAEVAPWLQKAGDAGAKNSLARTSSELRTVPRGEKSHRARLKALRAALRAYGQAEGEDRFVHLGEFVRSVTEGVVELRAALPRVAPLIARENWIRWRLDALRELESHLKEVLALPLAGMQVLALRELAGAYGDLIDGLRSMKMPKGVSPEEAQSLRAELSALVEPLAAKRTELLEQSVKLAQESGADLSLQSLTLESALSTWDPAGQWAEIFRGRTSGEPKSSLLQAWVRAVRAGSMRLEYRLWAEAEARLKMPDSTLKAMRAWMFVQSGCAAEAKGEVGELLRQPVPAKAVVGSSASQKDGGSHEGA